MMTATRYEEASRDGHLTEEEIAAGWRFCACEWGGLLVQAGDEEAKYCGCFFNPDGTVKEDVTL